MELRRYFLPLLRWWWLLLTATLVAAVFSFVAVLQQPAVYQARTTMMIGRTIEDPNPSGNEFYLSQQLAAAYADVASREMVRNATMESLGTDWLPEYRARALPNSQLIEITVVDTVPERAAQVTNELANQLILRSPTSAGPGEQNRQVFVSEQLDGLETQIQDTQAEIVRLQNELGGMTSARQINDTQSRIGALQNKLSTLQGNYADLLANTTGGAINTLSVIEPAEVPTRPIGPNRALSVLLAAASGLVLSAAAAYLLEYLDDTLKTSEDAERVTGAATLGYISEMDETSDEIFVVKNPRHPIAEAFRSLRTNLEFAGVDQPLKTVLVTSADSEDGKTSVAVNLAAVIAQGEKRVILVDADLRRPNVHKNLNLQNEPGLSEVFIGRMPVEHALRECSQGLIVLTAGGEAPNPTELLGSRKMGQILARLGELADVVIIDGPPFVVADAAVLATRSDGMLLVVRPGFTHQGAVKAMMQQIQRTGARVVGVVLNRIPLKKGLYYGGSRYFAPYYSGSRYFDDSNASPQDAGAAASRTGLGGVVERLMGALGMKRRSVIELRDTTKKSVK